MDFSVRLVDSILKIPDEQAMFLTKIFNVTRIAEVLWERKFYGANRYDLRACTSKYNWLSLHPALKKEIFVVH